MNKRAKTIAGIAVAVLVLFSGYMYLKVSRLEYKIDAVEDRLEWLRGSSIGQRR